ncbi:MAG: hypothetical protein E6G04_02705 [Actinobacteria bacterium]|nr:MAG: hypothetical protein E6G04_02705 [Actinomycetota bacterium]
MTNDVESGTEWLLSWTLAIVVAVLLGPVLFFAGTGLLSLGIGISNKTHLPLLFSWALVVIYVGVVVTTILRIRAARARRG